MPHVCILSCQHVPDDPRVTHKKLRHFREMGYRVTWCGPERPRSGDSYGADFRYYEASAGRVGRLAFHKARLYGLARQVDDVDVFYGVEPDSALVAARLAREQGARAVFSIHELYDSCMLDRWPLGPMRSVAAKLVRASLLRTCNQVDLVVGVNQSVLAPYDLTSTPRVVVQSCPPRSVAPVAPVPVFARGEPVVRLMHGKASIEHGTLAALEAVSLVKPRINVPLRLQVFSIFNPHESFDASDFWKLARTMGVAEDIDLLAPTSFDGVCAVMQSTDVGLYIPRRRFGTLATPNRLFEYMAMGLPIIAPEYAGDVADIVKGADCGIVVDCERPEELAEAIARLVNNPHEAQEFGLRARQAFDARYNWDVECAPLIRWIEEGPLC